MDPQIQRTLKLLPDRPGVYIMKNNGGQIIYVGKAKNLANRVRSYFHSPSGLNSKTLALVNAVSDLSYIVLESEFEALLLENNLIKQHKPYYNILLKDDKGYPSLRIDVREDYPSLTVARRKSRDGALYFGPFLTASLAREVAELTMEVYPLRSCKHNLTQKKGKIRPCMKYSIGRCVGPCQAEYKKEDYAVLVRNAVEFLKDDYKNIKILLQEKMLASSSRMDFEKAAYYRDRILHIDKIVESQQAVLSAHADLDVVAVCVEQGYAVFVTMLVRDGRMLGMHTDEFPDTAGSEGEMLEQYIMQRYTGEDYIPKMLLLSDECPSVEALSAHFSELSGHKVQLHVPKRGEKAGLVRVALKNCEEALQKSLKSEISRRERVLTSLAQLRDLLELEKLPTRIECFDISHIQGTDTVASMVVLTDGVPNPKEYRRFRIKTVEGNNDFASMAEVVGRRFKRALSADSKGFATLPDLVVIDGGKGQLSSACKVFEELGIDLPVIGLAERLEEIFLPQQSAPLVPGLHSPVVHLLQTVRDEAHRFAITYHRSLRSKRGLLSRLDEIPGVGKKRKTALFKAYGSVERIANATKEELCAVEGMNLPSANSVYEFFHKEKTHD